jgi:hypothetical protein
LGRRERGWKKKNKRQGEKCRGEEADGVDRRKWMGSAEREQTRRRRMQYAIVNEATWGRVEEFKVGERVDADHLPLEINI